LSTYLTKAKEEDAPPFKITTFHDELGIYFEKTGQLQQVESIWKLILQIDIEAIDIRVWQLQDYLNETKKVCKKLNEEIQPTCQNIIHVIDKDNTKLTQLILRLNTIFQTPNLKRGLINAIGSISKTLFGTMDADDAEKIDKQLQLLHNKQEILQHATKNQIKILNATIGHIKSLEETLNYNEDRITNVTKRIQKQIISAIRREDVDEHLLLLNAIMTDLINDIEDIIDFLTYTKHRIILTHLLPVEKIIAELREASTLLTNGLHFPFRIHVTNWRLIQTYVTISAHYKHPKIYVTLRFPIVAYPIYEIIKIIPLPIHKNANVFMLIKTTYPLLAIDRENRHYLLLSENDLNKCTQDHTKYTCEQNWPMYQVQTDAPCEVQVYVHTPQHTDNCERRHVLTNTTIWITLTEP